MQGVLLEVGFILIAYSGGNITLQKLSNGLRASGWLALPIASLEQEPIGRIISDLSMWEIWL